MSIHAGVCRVTRGWVGKDVLEATHTQHGMEGTHHVHPFIGRHGKPSFLVGHFGHVSTLGDLTG